ncbi:hypothetical protein BJ970_005003 [Saccharopolyspora phatthalungensis]|uniref:ATP/GTP-binding protein n=1 Tax=Saccharopolyspora phatthalungensis TaxID=664693 RepID=A0A840QFT9_9PSEU|nr:hypothetical protein [Saccharopolyspora phatthalungensis]
MITTAGGVVLLAFASTVPAVADPWGSVDCSQNPNPTCDLGAGQGGTNPGGGNPGRPQDSGQHSGGDGSAEGGEDGGGDAIVGGDNPGSHCSYVRSDYRPPVDGVATVAYRPPQESGAITVQPAVFLRKPARPTVLTQAPAPSGAWYVYRCDKPGFADALYRPPVWIPDGQPGAPLPSPAELAEQARNQLRLPSPRIEANPAGDQLVHLPTWLWLNQASWGQRSATASVPGVSVTAVATPTSVSWSMGDGRTVTCTGPGTPFSTGSDPKAASPDCGHIYRTSSAGQPNQAFPVIATVHWTITWSGAGQSGVFPDMTTSSTAAFRVAESQALGTGG